MTIEWSGLFPAVTTQFKENLAIDFGATRENVDRLIGDGVHGIVALGTCGENNSLTGEEKRQVLREICDVARGRVPVMTGVSELATATAVRFAADAAEIGVDALMVLPAMAYLPSSDELFAHFADIARATPLPIMIYNNPDAYGVNIEIADFARLAEIESVEAVKESSADIRRITDLINACGDRFQVFAGLDDVAMEAVLMGAQGWVSGLTNAFPAESLAIWDALKAGDIEKARAIYRWFADLLHLDARPDLVQCIKLVEQEMGRGSERVRPPRRPLAGETRAEVLGVLKRALETRPAL